MNKLLNNDKYSFFKEHLFFFSLLINCIFILIPLALGVIKYEVSDDFMMQLIVSGAYSGTPEPYIMFMHPLIGQLLSELYRISNNVNWYLLFQLSFIFISLCVIDYFFLQDFSLSQVIIVILFTAIVSMDLYCLVQFTKTSAIVAMAGVVFIINYLKSKNCYFFVSSIAFLILSFLIRRQCFYLALLFLILCFFLSTKQNKDSIKVFSKCLVCLFILLITTVGYEKLFLYFNSSYKEYLAFNKVRSQIVDFQNPPYVEIADQLSEINISENDYNLIISWNFFDESYFTTEKLNDVYNIIKVFRDNYRTMDNAINVIKSRNYKSYFIVWLYIAIILCFALQRNFNFIKISLISLFCLALIFYLGYVNRLIYRVEYSIILMALISVITVSHNNNLSFPIVNCVKLCLITLLLIPYIKYMKPHYDFSMNESMYYSWNYDSNKYGIKKGNTDVDDLRKYIESNSDKNFYLQFQTLIQRYYLAFGVFEPVKNSSFKNLMFIGGVDINNPVRINRLNGLSTAEQMIQPNTFIIDNDYISMIEQYYIEHVNKDFKLKSEKVISNYEIWNIAIQ